MSANTGIAFCRTIPLTVPIAVTGVVITSSPGSGSMAAMAV